MKRMGLAALTVLILMILAVAWAYFRFMHAPPLSAAELGELTPDWDAVTQGDWSPWHDEGSGAMVWNPVAAHNAWLASVPEDRKAWPVLVDVYYAHRDLLGNNPDLCGLPQEAKDWPLLRAALENPEVGEDVRRLVESFNKPVLGAILYEGDDPFAGATFSNMTGDPVELEAMRRHGVENASMLTNLAGNPAIIGAVTPGNKRLRAVSGLLVSYAHHRAGEGDAPGFLGALDAASKSARYYDQFPTLINQLAAIGIESAVDKAIAYTLQTGQLALTDAQLARLDRIVARHQQRGFLWQGEAIASHDGIRRMTTPEGVIFGSSVATLTLMGGLNGPPCDLPDARLDPGAQRALHAANLRLMSVDTGLPWDPSAKRALVERADGARSPFFTDKLAGIDAEFIERVGAGFRAARQRHIATRLAIAVHRHSLRHGTFPQRLDAIDDDLLAFEPVDAFGGTLTLTLTNEGPVIYSKGDDRDDDGGAPGLAYDIEALFEEPDPSNRAMVNRHNASKKQSTGRRDGPLWATPERVREIQEVEPKAVDGDWVLYPLRITPSEPAQDASDEDSDDPGG